MLYAFVAFEVCAFVAFERCRVALSACRGERNTPYPGAAAALLLLRQSILFIGHPV